MSRRLTEKEAGILAMIQGHYGPQNTEDSVTWVNNGEATLWVRDKAGAMVVMAHISNLAKWHADGTISSEELCDWLLIRNT